MHAPFVAMHACMGARMHACMYARMHACTYACTHACTHAGMHACRHAGMHACMHACMPYFSFAGAGFPQNYFFKCPPNILFSIVFSHLVLTTSIDFPVLSFLRRVCVVKCYFLTLLDTFKRYVSSRASERYQGETLKRLGRRVMKATSWLANSHG